MRQLTRYAVSGCAAGSITGLLGTGGGLILVPLFSLYCHENDDLVFPLSVATILPTCIFSLFFQDVQISFSVLFPYLLGSLIGGLFAIPLSKRIPILWLHKIFGILMLWGGIRFLC